MTPGSGCAYVCADPECNEATLNLDAKCCSHCGKTELQRIHLSGAFDKQRQAFVCSDCGEEMSIEIVQRFRQIIRTGELGTLAPGLSGLFDLTDH
jgi:predicted RNA-binding Zn-ribbon protein involved in translation (DUF1610 family)